MVIEASLAFGDLFFDGLELSPAAETFFALVIVLVVCLVLFNIEVSYWF